MIGSSQTEHFPVNPFAKNLLYIHACLTGCPSCQFFADKTDCHTDCQHNKCLAHIKAICILSLYKKLSRRIAACPRSPAMEKTAPICARSEIHCQNMLYTIYFFAWDKSPVSLVSIILYVSFFYYQKCSVLFSLLLSSKPVFYCFVSVGIVLILIKK